MRLARLAANPGNGIIQQTPNRRGMISSGVLVIVLATATAIAWDRYDSGVAGSSFDGPAIFQTRGCVGCHSIEGVSVSAGIGPNLTGLGQRAGGRVEGLDDRAYVIQSIRSPEAFIVPGYGRLMPTIELSDEELDVVVDFLLDDR